MKCFERNFEVKKESFSNHEIKLFMPHLM